MLGRIGEVGLAVEAEYSDFVGSAPAYGKELILVAKVA